MNKKRIFAFLLAASLSAGALVSCGGGETSAPAADSGSTPASETASTGGDSAEASDSGETASSDGVYQITMCYPGPADQPDYQAVMDAINELTMEELNMSFNGIQLGFGDWTDRIRLMLTGGEKLDIVPTYATQASAYVSQGLVLNLLDWNGTNLLEEYGSGIIEAVGETHTYGGQINGVLYGIPSQKEAMGTAGIVMRKDIVDELGLDYENWSTYEDLTDAFTQVHEAHPELNVVVGWNMVTKFYPFDYLNDSFGVLMMDDPDNLTLEVENLFETDYYMDMAKIIHEWYTNGWVMLDAATTTETSSNLMKAGNAFCYFSPIKPGFLAQEESLTARELVTQVLYPEWDVIGSDRINFVNWGIAHQSEDPVKAMEFLEFAFTSGEFEDLLNFGIEGQHYVKMEGSDVMVTYPEGVDATNCGYHLAVGWALPNQFVGSVWEGNPEDVWDQYRACNEASLWSKAYGFIPDTSAPEIANIQTALTNVYNTYMKSIECGAVDPETIIPQMNQELYAAGLQEYMDEKQRQLDAWAEANGVS